LVRFGCEDCRQIDVETGRCVVGRPDADIDIAEVILLVA
jgi:hypothetical protein